MSYLPGSFTTGLCVMISDPDNLHSAGGPTKAGEPSRDDCPGSRRQGKVARLPKALREEINIMLLDGAAYSAVIAHLDSHGHPGFSDSNISNWFLGGFRDWQREQATLDAMRVRQEFALRIVQENKGSTVHEAASQLAASQMYDVISQFDPQALKDLLESEPANYAKVVTALGKLGDGALKFEKYRDLVREQKEKISNELNRAKGKGGLTPETITRIEEELKLL